MKFGSVLCGFLIHLTVWGQITEDFSDGNFDKSPAWNGDPGSFVVNKQGQLQLNGTGSGLAYLSTASPTSNEASWEFEVGMAFNPSARNLCRVYLISDLRNLGGDLNGYYVRIGGSEDEISLYRQDISKHTKIIDGVDGLVNKDSVSVVIRVTRDLLGTWRLYTKSLDNAAELQLIGEVVDNKHLRANFFGFYCRFTSTRSSGFFLDNIRVKGRAFVDALPPEILSLRVLDRQSLEVNLDEPIQLPEVHQFQVVGLGFPTSVERSSYNAWELSFPFLFKNSGRYTLEITNLKDLSGNAASFLLEFQFWETAQPRRHDIVISEIMADPSPALQLPETEYLEIYNRSDKAFNLKGWTLSDATKTVALPEYQVLPGFFVVLSPENNEDQLPLSNSLELSSWLALNNSDDLIMLADSTGEIIHFVSYSDNWYRSSLKKHGGWSLEMIDLNYPCSGASNWTAASAASGGTPGEKNSVATDNPDLTPPVIVNTLATGPHQVRITFDQALSTNRGQSHQISFKPAIAIDTFFIQSAVIPEVTVLLKDSLEKGTIYQVTATRFADCHQNVNFQSGLTAPVGLAQSPDSADMVINELLFNPRPLGVRFIELFNRSSKALNLRNWRFARRQNQALVDFTILTNEDHMIYPGEYRVFTIDPEKLKNQYPASSGVSMVTVDDLPSLGDKEGSVVLVSLTGKIIDALQYHHDMHHPLLIDENGVSLERASPNMETNDPNNWYSGSESTSYATPGLQNSQFFQDSPNAEFLVEPRIISHLSVQFPTYARIVFNLDQPGYSGSILIFNQQGFLVRTLVNNSILPAAGFYQWDGTDDHARRVSIGYYVVLFQLSQPDGRTTSWRETMVVAPAF